MNRIAFKLRRCGVTAMLAQSPGAIEVGIDTAVGPDLTALIRAGVTEGAFVASVEFAPEVLTLDTLRQLKAICLEEVARVPTRFYTGQRFRASIRGRRARAIHVRDW